MKKEKPYSDKTNKKEPLDDEMMAAVYLTVVNKQNPIDFTEVLKAHRKEDETKQFFKHVEELVKPQRKKSYKEESAPQKRDVVVPDDLKSEDVEFFFRELEKETVVFEGKGTKLLDRTSLPWVFVSKKIAAYVTNILHDDYSLYFAAALMGKVTGHTGQSLRDLYRKMKASEEWPIGTDVVDKVLKRCNRHRLNKE